MNNESPTLPEEPLHRGRGWGGSSLSQSSHLSPRTIEHLLTTLAEEVAQALARGESYTIPGIGTISTKELRAKSTSNLVVGDGDPMGEHITPARRKIKFRAELDLLRRANGLSAPGSLPVVR